ncbi:MAG: hypothetical protein JOZ42_15200 [Acetobacteraceae bacterium]|nr:hypothetical protein [Acetobacteraceae bacterium]
MAGVSRDLIRAVLEVRDHRHNETHAALVGLFQALAAELVQSGDVRAEALADRLDHVRRDVTADPHGEAARALLEHITGWLRSIEPAPRIPHPVPWEAPPISVPVPQPPPLPEDA